MRANELTPEQGLALDRILKVRVEAKKRRQAARTEKKEEAEAPA
jgi:hypothetical protein